MARIPTARGGYRLKDGRIVVAITLTPAQRRQLYWLAKTTRRGLGAVGGELLGEVLDALGAGAPAKRVAV